MHVCNGVDLRMKSGEVVQVNLKSFSDLPTMDPDPSLYCFPILSVVLSPKPIGSYTEDINL